MKLIAAAVFALAFAPAAQAAPDPSFDIGTNFTPLSEPAPAPKAAGQRANGGKTRSWVVIEAADEPARSKAADAGVSIEEVGPDEIAGIASKGAIERLKKAGLSFKVTDLDARFSVLDFPQEDAAFHDYKELTTELTALAGSAPEVASLFSIGTSVQGRAMPAVRLNTTAKGTEPSDKPGIVFLGTHHAREHLSTEMAFLLAKHLIDNRAKPNIAKLLDTRDIYIIPMVNPDGVEHDIRGGQYHMHRKNMRDVGDGEYGVDLNRNYGFHWGEGGASKDPSDDTYRGPSAFSEPESSAVKAFVEARKNLKVLLSYHTFSELILYPWGHSHSPIDDTRARTAYETMARAMAKMTGYTPKQSSGLYIASGDTTDWSWGVHKIFSFTFELTPKSMWSGGFYPGAKAIASTVAANIPPALYLIDLADDPYRASAPSVGAAK
jgi:carboxypeptidase T